ncbi:MAG: ATP synthase F1 subunit delta [Oligoflexales bacterium]
MAEQLVARRYSKALFAQYSNNLSEANKILESLEALAEVFKDRKARKLLVSPITSPEFKIQVFDQIIDAHSLNPGVKQLVHLLCESGRIEIFPFVVSSFKELCNRAAKVMDVEVRSSIALSEETLANVAKVLEQKTGNKAKIVTVIDKTLLGGFVLKIGNRIIDLSLRSKLDAWTKSAAY